MAPKRATFYTYGKDTVCDDALKFIEGAGILLTIRDLEQEPLTYDELKMMIGYINLTHFVNPMAPEYQKKKVDTILHDRVEVLKVIAEDNSILRRPIIRTVRLLTVGCNKKKISEMLQVSMAGSETNADEPRGNLKNSKYVTRRTSSRTTGTSTTVSQSK